MNGELISPVQHPLLFFCFVAPTTTAIQIVLMGDGLVPALGMGIAAGGLASAATWLVNPRNW